MVKSSLADLDGVGFLSPNRRGLLLRMRPLPQFPRLSDRAICVLIPMVTGLWGVGMRLAKGPFYFPSQLDPTYAYLLNGLSLLRGEGVFHTDHPGTPLQLFCAAVIRIGHALRGGDMDVTTSVLSSPESYLQAIHAALLVFIVAAQYFLGTQLLRVLADRRLLVLPALPLLSFSVNDGLSRVYPETMLIAWGLVFSGLAIRVQADPSSRTRWAGLVLGLVGGFAAMTKITFLPFALAGIFICRLSPWRLYYGLGLLLSGGMTLLLVAPRLAKIIEFYGRLAGNRGLYGMGSPGWIDLAWSLEFLGSLPLTEPLVVVGFGWVMVAGFYGVRRIAQSSGWLEVAQSPLTWFWLAALGLLFLVIRHPKAYYLAPAVVLSPWALYAVMVNSSPTRWLKSRLWLGALVLVLLTNFTSFGIQLGGVFRTAGESRAANDYARQLKSEGFYAASYLSSDPVYALDFGNEFSGHQYSAALSQLYPRYLEYLVWGGYFRHFGVRLDLLSGEGVGPIYLSGSWLTENPDRLPAGYSVTKLEQIGDQSFYRLDRAK